VRLPPGMAAREVKRELEAIASDLMVDLDFRES
jgi:glycine cleavage system regulatory protein